MGRSRERLRAEIGSFLRMYGRGRSPGHDPNDRGYSREMEEAIKRLPPEELDRLMRDDEDDEPAA